MSAISVNTFPAINTFHSPRSWFLALIIILHVGFFFALSNGLSFSTLILKPQDLQVVRIDRQVPPIVDEPVLVPQVKEWWIPTITEPTPNTTIEDEREQSRAEPGEGPAIALDRRTDPTPAQPVIVEPAIPRSGLSEPLYPPSEIRAEHTGTVILLLEILTNGRVGQIRLAQSSGYAKLDQSALREARNWRFIPGSREGIPTVLWKEVPITFALQDRK